MGQPSARLRRRIRTYFAEVRPLLAGAEEGGGLWWQVPRF